MRKTPQKTPSLRKPKHGKGMLRVGNPGNAGGGRPKDDFVALCQELASGEKTIETVREILEDSSNTQFMAALRWATENGYGKATERVELTGKDGSPIGVSVKFGATEIPL